MRRHGDAILRQDLRCAPRKGIWLRAVLAVLRDVNRMRMDAFEEVIDAVRTEPPCKEALN